MLTSSRINITKFEQLCTITINLWFEIYPNESLILTIHKVLKHGSDAIDYFQNRYDCWIGIYTEESSEALNHRLKQARAKSRQNSRVNLYIDTIRNLYLRTNH